MPYIPTRGISPGTIVPCRDPSTSAFDSQPRQAGASNTPPRGKSVCKMHLVEGRQSRELSSAGVGGESLVGAVPCPRVTAVPCHIGPSPSCCHRVWPSRGVSSVLSPCAAQSSARCCPLPSHSCLSLTAASPKFPLRPPRCQLCFARLGWDGAAASLCSGLILQLGKPPATSTTPINSGSLGCP